jgi:cardiolipin synthase
VAKPFRRALIILLWAALVIATGLLLAQDHETLRVRSEIAADDPRSPAFVAALVGAALTRGNRYEVLTNGDQFFPSMLQAIDAARRRINFETYIYDTGEIAKKFTDALERAARRGVHVTLVADGVGAWPDPTHTERLRNAGARVLTFNPTRWYSLEDVNFRTHRKILVMDGEVGFTGGAGVADHWLGHAQDADHWRDTQVRIQGPIVRLLEAAFYENAMESHGPLTPELDDTPISLDETGASIVVRSSPTGGSTDLKRLYLLAMASARRTLDITSPYFVTDESSMWALRMRCAEASRSGSWSKGTSPTRCP